ncbi:SEC-C metal-binding domain-containing protein [Anaeromyxobacter oryzisoli]|uniref:SEC-C metal-binding domain-containing protein n=1 Tax=Anaeromyxobacter oryzisoli TaxID=2925408 RepID=UPI001F587710|nr:SEC-C metal-binding domain-containing protein [Anaeromyxobacter sp. SG63]
MVHVFRLGPFEVGGRKSYAYGGLESNGRPIAPELAHTDAKGLGAIAKRYAGQRLRCEPDLAEAARPFGFEPAPLPEPVFLPRATLAYGLALGPMAGRPEMDVLVRFLGACAMFWNACPWELMESEEPIVVTLTESGRTRRAEASVMGAGGQEFGIALYDEPGSIHRVATLVSEGRMKETRNVSALAVTFDEEPAWAAAALDDEFGLPRLPVPIRVRKGQGGPATTPELLDAAALLEAVAELCSPNDADQAEITAEAGGRTITVRVSLPDDDGDELLEELAEPMLVPEPIPATGRAKTPRNAPCPCGSGRKYKKCHLAEDEEREAAARGTGREVEEARARARRLAERDPIHALDERITADALALARRRWGRAFDPDGALARLGLDFECTQSLLGWSSGHHRGLDGRTALDLYLEERGGALDAEGRALVEAQRAAWFSYHEVVSAEPGRSITLRDVLAGGERTVEEKSASRMVRPRDVLLARVLELGSRAILAGCHLRSVPPREGDEARRRLRSALRVRAAKVPAAKLREATADGTLFRVWQEIVDASDARPPPTLQNTDGEDLVLTVDRLDVAAGKADEVVGGLVALPDARRDEGEDDGVVTISFVREGNAKGVLPTTLIGRALLEGGVLRLETNSIERADRLRRLVTERLGALVSFRIREHADPVAHLAEGAKPGARSAPSEFMPPEVLEVVKRMQTEHYQRWLDEEIPALGGLTPREAAKRKGAPRKSLELLLAEIEHAEAGRPEEQRFDVSVLRRALEVQ